MHDGGRRFASQKADGGKSQVSSLTRLTCRFRVMIPRLRNRTGNRYLPRALVGLVTVMALGGCNYRFGVPDPSTTQSKEVLTLWQVSLYAAVALGVLVLGILLYSIIRHRRFGKLGSYAHREQAANKKEHEG